MTIIRIETAIEAPAEVCFDLALDVDAHRESAAFSNERLVEPGRLTGILQLGDLVTFEGRHLGVRQRFTARITEVHRPRRFVDEMVHGIFTSLRHVHDFVPAAGGTLMIDTLEWRAPLGILGRIADALFLRRHMTWFVTKKQAELKRIAEARASR